MKLEIKIEETHIKVLNEEPFEFKTLQITDEQRMEMVNLANVIEQNIKDKFCFNHEESRVMISISWFLKISGPFIGITTCCPIFANRLHQILLKQGIISHASFLKALQSSSLN